MGDKQKMRKAVKITLRTAGIVLAVAFWAIVLYDYHLIMPVLFIAPLGFGFAAFLSGLLFLVPSAALMSASFLIRDTAE